MVTALQQARPARAAASDALVTARRRVGGVRPQDAGVLALQRAAGNAAVSALMAARFRGPSEAAAKDIDKAVREFRNDEPAIDPVERGLKAAKALGVPVDLEGIRPPASALAVVTTGFGPGNIAAKRPVPPPKRTPAVSPLGRAAARKGGAVKTASAARPAPAAGGGAPSAATGPMGLGADQLLQPPVKPVPVRPEADPAFARVTGTVKATARQKRSHPPAGAKAKEAQDAALPPAGDIGSQAKAAKADTMDAQRPGTFDKKAFIAAVKAAIEAKSPKTLKEAAQPDGKAGDVKAEVKSLVTEGEQGQAADIKAATDAPPDQSKAVPKPVTPMATESPGTAPPIPATGAVPKPAPPDQVNLAAGKHEVNAEMAADNVSEKQLAESNEPQFQEALSDKKAAAAHADTAPGEYRQQEQQVIAQGKTEATAESAAGVAGIQGSRGKALAQLVAAKGKTKTKDEAKRAEVSGRIEQIFATTETDVKKILDGIDPKVEKQFDAGEAIARRTFETYVKAKMSAYKKDRYGGWLGGLRWAKDKLFGMPDKVNEFYVAGRELYLKEMDKTINRVADTVGTDLNAAKARIAKGRLEIADYVKSLPKDLKRVGADASKEIGDRFEQLEDDVDAKSEALVDTLASKYVEARKGLDERIEELQAENKGLVDKAIGAIKAVINTIRELVGMLTNALARAASVIGDIVSAPVKFLGNLIAGVKGGILKFKDDFLGHLRRGLMSWLFGALAEGGVEPPKSFDLKGIVGFLASIFGLTWANIRNRIVLRIGEKAMGAVEKGVEVFKVMSGPEGIGGLWQMLMEKLGDIKEMIFEQVKDFVQDRIISAGISWLIGLLNPVGAFIKACKLIYDIVMFFVDNAARIAKFVNTVLDSVVDVARGNISGVVNKVNDALGQMVPIIIGFLASLVNLGGVGQKVREIIKKLQKPVTKAIDFLISTGLKLAAPIIRGIAGISKKVKAKVAAGKAWVKGKAEAGKKWVKGKVEAGKKWVKGTKGESAPSQTSPVAIDEPFTIGAQGHHIFTGVGGRLMVASNTPQPVSNLDRLKSLNDRYRALPASASTAERKRIVDDMITIVKADPSLIAALAGTHQIYDPPNLGDVAQHKAQPARWMPENAKPAFAPLWHLESEHVVPKAYLDKLFEAIDLRLTRRGLGMPRITGDEYESMTTVVIYKGAADIKTDAGGGDAENIRRLTDEFDAEIGDLRRARNFSEDREADHEEFLDRAAAIHNKLENAFDAHGAPQGVRKRTVDAITTEWGQNAVTRGWPSLAQSTAKRDQVIAGVDQAHAAQLRQLKAFFDARLTFVITSAESRRRGR